MNLKATEDLSGICCSVGARMRFAKYKNDLETEYGICEQDAYFDFSE